MTQVRKPVPDPMVIRLPWRAIPTMAPTMPNTIVLNVSHRGFTMSKRRLAPIQSPALAATAIRTVTAVVRILGSTKAQ